MKPGRELDALVAEKVMGLEPWPGRPGAFKAKVVPRGREPKPCLPPSYSTDIAAAWEVVGKLNRWHFELTRLADLCGWEYRCTMKSAWPGVSGEHAIGTSEISAPHAICLSAMKAVGHHMTLDGTS